MDQFKNKNNKKNTVEILEDVIVVDRNNVKRFYKAIHVTKNLIYTGFINDDKEFIEDGGFHRSNIKYLNYVIKRIVFSKGS
jgi:hypothetical protein